MPKPLVETKRLVDIVFKDNGYIFITSHIAARLNLKSGDTINVIPYEHEYLLVANHVARDKDGNPIGRYRSAVSHVKKGQGSMRCNNKELCTCINFITQAAESHLFCGVPKEGFMHYDIAIPLITSNNQYGK